MSRRADVARLFVGLPLPASVARDLARLQPDPGAGVRPTGRSDLHVTLHFLGRRNVAAVREALQSVRAPGFSLRFTAACLKSAGGRKRIFWAGIEPVSSLSLLHAKTAEALAAVGFEAEARVFTPHVTLARLTPEASESIAAALRAVAVPQVPFACRRFALYSSQTRPEGARYEIIDSWPLGPIRSAAEHGTA